MNNLKKIIAVAVIFSAIIAFPVITKSEIKYQDVESDEIIETKEEVLIEIPANVAEINEESKFKINLNFNFQDNRENFFKSVDIFLIGFSIVFIVMIIFIFVSRGIDKMFPYEEEVNIQK